MISKPKTAGERVRAEVGIRNERVVVAGLLAAESVDAMQDVDEIGSGAAAGVEHANGGAGEAEGSIELGAEQVIDALDHVADDFSGVYQTPSPCEARGRRLRGRARRSTRRPLLHGSSKNAG